MRKTDVLLIVVYVVIGIPTDLYLTEIDNQLQTSTLRYGVLFEIHTYYD